MNYFVPVQIGAPDYKFNHFFNISIYRLPTKDIANNFIPFQFFNFNPNNSVCLQCRSFLRYSASVQRNISFKGENSHILSTNDKTYKSIAEPLNIKKLGPYLAGLWEGDGHLLILIVKKIKKYILI